MATNWILQLIFITLIRPTGFTELLHASRIHADCSGIATFSLLLSFLYFRLTEYNKNCYRKNYACHIYVYVYAV